MNPALLRLAMRLFGTASLTAVFFVAAPYSLLDAIHQRLGLGEFTHTPITDYLARSTSALYALLGGLLWTLSFDLERHAPVVRYVGAAIALFGLSLYGIDYRAGLPLFWTLWEGTVVTAFGLLLFIGSRRLDDRA